MDIENWIGYPLQQKMTVYDIGTDSQMKEHIYKILNIWGNRRQMSRMEIVLTIIRIIIYVAIAFVAVLVVSGYVHVPWQGL